MGVRITRSFKPLRDMKLSTKDLMREVGLLARERVIRRTIAGQDQNGAPFQPYSAAYAIRKASEVGGGGVNLQLSGAMLNALTIIELTDTSVTLGFR